MHRPCLASVAFIALTTPIAAQRYAVNPPEFEKHEGNTGSSHNLHGIPWHVSERSRRARLQVILDLDRSVAGSISNLAFRRDSSFDPGLMTMAFWVDLEIRCSTSPRTSSTMSNLFASNIGRDATVVVSRKRLSIAPKPYVGTFPEPFLFGFAFDRRFLYAASKGSLCVEFRSHDNSLYDRNTQLYNHVFMDAFHHELHPAARISGAELQGPSEGCFASHGWARVPMFINSHTRVHPAQNRVSSYTEGYKLEAKRPAVLAAATSLFAGGGGIALDCGKFRLSLTRLLFLIPAITDFRGYVKIPSSGTLDMRWEPKTMQGARLYTQMLSIDPKGQLRLTNWHLRALPVLPARGNRFAQASIYRNGVSAFTSPTGSTNHSSTYQRGAVYRLTY